MPHDCQHCGAPLAVGAIACFRCGRMVAAAEEPTGPSLVVAGTQLGTVAKAQLLEDQWRLVKPLGRGQTGEVWQAHDVTLDRFVAVKLMHAELAADPAQVARFEREARVLAGLEHPHLLPVLGIGRLGDRPFLVTRLLEGKTLAEVMHGRGGTLPASEAARVLAPICDALACLHAANVVHRDLKPSNVFVGDDGRVTLMDLGSALEAGSELTRFGEVLGTHGYLSPEQKLGKRTLDGKSDVYGVGCLLREVLTGAPDVDRDVAPPGVPPALLALAQRATALQPEDRPTAAALRAQLLPYFAHEEATTPMGAALVAEAPTQGAVFTPTTGSPEYPHLRAVPAPEPETRKAPPTSSTLVLPKGAAVATSSTLVLSKEARVRAAPRPRLSKQTQALLGVGACLLCVAFGVGLLEREPPAPLPARIDRPAVPVTIAKEDKTVTIALVDPPKPDHVVSVPRLEERKTGLYDGSGAARALGKRPNLKAPKLGNLRISTVIGEFLVPATLWTKGAKSKDWQLRGRTPLELEVTPGLLSLKLQYEDDPPEVIPYRVLPRKDWPKEQGGMHLIVPLRNTELPAEYVSEGKRIAQGVTPPEAVKPMTPQPPRGRK